jgi:phosphohistidine swiveling domain-containing protein
MSMYVVDLGKRQAAQSRLVGGKAAHLHRLVRAGFNVPPAAIVTTRAFELFVHANSLRPLIRSELERMRGGDQHSATGASRTIQKAILDGRIPELLLAEFADRFRDSHPVAVRSSAAFEDSRSRSWAGQFDSFLNIAPVDVPEHVRRCWASFFSTRALLYRPSSYKRVSFRSFAVIVQQMVAAERSGVAFSVDPAHHDPTKILIEATTGFGDSLVSGERVPFSALLDKASGIVLRRVAAKDQLAELLTLRDLRRLWSDVRAIERTLVVPVDVEWSISRGKVYYLQARPITALRRLPSPRTRREPDIRDYELTFKVTGLSFLFTDMLADGFSYMNPVFTSYRSEFLQYFSNDRMEFAAKEGVAWLGKPKGFESYRVAFTRYYERNSPALGEMVSKRVLSGATLRRFFGILSRLFTFYSRMDFPFTNLTYIYAKDNLLIRRGLDQLAQFKDLARAWINATSIEDTSPFAGLIRRIALESGVPAADVECYRMAELSTLLAHGKKVSVRELRARREAFVVYVMSREKRYMVGSKAARFVSKNAAIERVGASSEIVGQVANRTVSSVEGIVKVINVDYGNLERMNREMSNMRKGDILVADFTAPELMEACRKAKAIVTDLGGMLSHAAIVSRELRIPCLVGTHYATKTLRTGDRVTIDFGSGTLVRIEPGAPATSERSVQ